MPELTPIGPDTAVPAPSEAVVSEDIPSQEGLLGSGRGADLGKVTFEDYFPEIDIDEDEEQILSTWFERDLRSCVKNINAYKYKWAMYRAVYMLEYVQKYYPEIEAGADYASGLLCEKVLEGMDRMKKSVFRAAPYFNPDFRTTGSSNDVDFFNRAQWSLHTMLDDLGVSDAIGDAGFFDFVTDGSLIIEADNIYEKVPQRTIKTYTDMDALVEDEEKILDQSRLEQAYDDLTNKGVARVLIEEDVVTKNGLQFFRVDKLDHLVPQGVLDDSDIKFRARRMYLTKSDLRLLANDDVNWYDKKKVEEVINERNVARGYRGMGADEKATEQLRAMSDNYSLMYHWHEEDDELKANAQTQPYTDVYAIYRVLCKYGYKTKSDPQGVIPKYCLFDYSPEGRKILRAVTYPHFKERRNYFHFKLGYAPKSYYGFGYGARCLQDDFLESNAVGLFMNTAAFACFNPYICRHPDAGGRFPFTGGFGPGKIGYAMDPQTDFFQMKIAQPSEALLRNILPIVRTHSANKTSVTSLVQGQTESSDPRSPAAKTSMLLGQASVGLDVMIGDWGRTGWEPLAAFTWFSMYEQAVFAVEHGVDVKNALNGLVVVDGDVTGKENVITMDELKRNVKWKSGASSDYLNPELRVQRFIQHFMFFMPLLKEMAQFSPDLYKTYFMRWMSRASQEMDLPGSAFLVPTADEIKNIPNDNLQGVLENLVSNAQSGAVPGVQNIMGGGTAKAGGR